MHDKVKAQPIPFSSVVGGGILLLDPETGQALGQLMILGYPPLGHVVPPADEVKAAVTALADHIARAINCGQADCRKVHAKNGTLYDVIAPKALFQLSAAGKVADIHDGDEVSVYVNPETGMTFVRFPDEMDAPRFTAAQAPAPEA